MYFIVIFLQVTVNLFSKYNIENIAITESGKKVVNINKKNLLAPYYKLPRVSSVKIFVNFKNKRYSGKKNIKRKLNGSFFIRKINDKLFLFQKLELNDYVLGVLNSEIEDIDKIPLEALKAFYLIIKNYSLTHLKRHKKIGADFCDIAHCQLYYISKKHNSCKHGNSRSEYRNSPLRHERGLFHKKIYYHNTLAITPYSSSCGKYTCDSETIWNKAYPYLKGKKLNSVLDKWQYKLSKKDLIRIVGKNAINKLILKNGCVKNGENFRRKINQNLGWNKIKSNVFTIKEFKTYYLIKGSGFGHNVGFCIKEAILLANQRMNYKEIIKYFFKNVEIR